MSTTQDSTMSQDTTPRTPQAPRERPPSSFQVTPTLAISNKLPKASVAIMQRFLADLTAPPKGAELTSIAVVSDDLRRSQFSNLVLPLHCGAGTGCLVGGGRKPSWRSCR
jgi:hypothetical protein